VYIRTVKQTPPVINKGDMTCKWRQWFIQENV